MIKPSALGDQTKFDRRKTQIKLEYDQARSAGMKIIFIDEAIFSSTTSLKRSWS